VEDVVPAHHDPENAIPRGQREEHEQDDVVHVLEAEPPQCEEGHALYSQEEHDAQDPAPPAAEGGGAAVLEELSVVVPVRHEKT
jgi:hypothetical protein